ncbi:MAG: hypothetical protein LBL86_06540 [Coriobacteriales bacterium]|jgi:hypothetical protein|nr:hypothetical protein [Coriobacteriales bacterium]
MNKLSKTEKQAKALVEGMMPFLLWQSGDVRDEYDAGEYVAAADGAIHDLGALRADLPEEILDEIGGLIGEIRKNADPYAARFIVRMETGLAQLATRRELMQPKKTA